MGVAFKDIWRSRLRFGLLAGAVGLLFFLLLFLNTLSSTLLGSFVGAIENGSSDVLVFSEEAQSTIAASRLDPSLADDVASIAGVAAVGTISELTAGAELGGDSTDVSLWGVDFDRPGAPADITEGRAAGPGEAVMDTASKDAGFGLGDTLTVGTVDLTVVGFADDASYAVVPTAYVTAATWSEVFAAEYPAGAGFVPVNLIGVEVADGADETEVAAAITSSIAGVEAFDKMAAAASTPGVSSISQSFGLIVGITFAIVVVVVGFFFQILTVQKLKAFAVLKAIGAGTGKLAGVIVVQIVTMVALGVLIGAGMLAAAAAATRDTFAIGLDYGLIATAGGVVLISSLIAGLFSIRRVAQQDPAQAAMGGAR